MQVPEAAAFFGQTFDVWVGIFMAVLAAYAVVVLARRKRRSFASLGDHEPYEEPDVNARPPGAAPMEHDPARADTRALEMVTGDQPLPGVRPETRR
jgi:hypothetical protein